MEAPDESLFDELVEAFGLSGKIDGLSEIVSCQLESQVLLGDVDYAAAIDSPTGDCRHPAIKNDLDFVVLEVPTGRQLDSASLGCTIGPGLLPFALTGVSCFRLE